MKQALVLVTGALLLSQLANGLPHMKREAVSVQTQTFGGTLHFHGSSQEEDNPQVQLMRYTLGEIAQLAKWLLDQGSAVVRNAVHDLNEIPVKSELLQANITRMSHMATEKTNINLESKEGIVQLFEYLLNFATMMDDYESMPVDSELRITLKTALENNGYNKLESEFEQKVMSWLKISKKLLVNTSKF